MWLLKDICWMMHYKTVGLIIFIPTIILALFLCMITFKTSHFLPNIAVSCWIGANGTWMLGEFFVFDYKPLSLLLFMSGTLTIAAYFLIKQKTGTSEER